MSTPTPEDPHASALLDEALTSPGEHFDTLARHLASWTRVQGAGDLVALAVLAAAAAESRGDACAELAALAGTSLFQDGPCWPAWDTWRRALDASPWVGDGRSPAGRGALVLERDGACFLTRVWRDEHALASEVRQRAESDESALPTGSAGSETSSLLAELFAAGDGDQREAALAAASGTLLLLTGPPGSGKTHTLLRALLVRRAVAGRKLSVALAAPTGKAAQRIGEALKQGKQLLALRLPDSPILSWLDEIPDTAGTLHRLLEYRPAERAFARSARVPLTADVVVVDEASMVDLAMMRRVFEATPAHALLLLSGDPDQLASVAAGSVLADLVRASEAAQKPLPRVARLTRSRRATGDFGQLFEFVQRGEGTAAIRDLRERDAWHSLPHAAALDSALAGWVSSGRFDALLEAQDPVEALSLLVKWQCLCALRVGPFGATAVAARIEELLPSRSGFRPTRDGSFHGRAVIIEQNDYGKRLFNGDVGVMLVDGSHPARVWFAADRPAAAVSAFPDEAYTGTSLRSFAPGELPAHSSAFALTVHKAQGAEFDAVALVMPPQDARVLGRELVYTALTRARSRVDVYASESVFTGALARPLGRRGRLRERIRGET